MVKGWVKLSFLYLFIVGILGCLLRWLVFAPVDGLNFRNLLHAHSHVAFLGWVFNALFIGYIVAYIPEKAKSYKYLFWLLQFAVLGMLVSFPIQGYAAISITFSTLHILLSYWFAWKFLKDTSRTKTHKYPFSLHFIRWSLVFMVISSFGPFALGAIMAKGLSGTSLYQLAIYYYLHFQYDGWFSFGVLGLFFWLLEHNKIAFHPGYGRIFLWLMVLACVPAYALSTLWTQPPLAIYIIGFLAATAQVIALICLTLLSLDIAAELKGTFHHRIFMLMKFAFGAFIIKIVLQFASAFPVVAELAFKVRNFTVGYLHIVFLGFVSVILIAWFAKTKLISLDSKTAQSGIFVFLLGFVASELIIFLQPLVIMWGGGVLPFGHQALFFISLLMPLGTAMLFITHKRESTEASTSSSEHSNKVREEKSNVPVHDEGYVVDYKNDNIPL